MKKLLDSNPISAIVEENMLPWDICMALQAAFSVHDIPYSFSTNVEQYQGVFKLFTGNPMKVAVEKTGDVILFYESEQYTSTQLRKLIAHQLKADHLGVEEGYTLSIQEKGNGPYTVIMYKKLLHKPDSTEFAWDVAFEQLMFQLNVNDLVYNIKDLRKKAKV